MPKVDPRLFRFYPMLLSSEKGKEDSDQEYFALWSHFDSLPQGAKDVLIANQTAEDIEKIGRGFHLSENETEDIARMLRKLFFGEIKPDSLQNEIHRLFPSIHEKDIPSLVNIVNNRFYNPGFTAKPAGKNLQFEKIPLLEALKKYPLLSSQMLTRAPIIFGKEKQQVRPTIENWIKQYQFEVGATGHDPMKRGNFLFLSANAKHLAPQERQRLASVLKSLDEGEPLQVDVMKQELMFVIATTAPRPGTPAAMSSAHFNQVQAPPPLPRPISNPGAPQSAAPTVSANVQASSAPKPPAQPIRPLGITPGGPIAGRYHQPEVNIPNRFFQKPIEREVNQQGTSIPTQSPKENISFSSGQKLPSEQNIKPNNSNPTEQKMPSRPPMDPGHTAKNLGNIIDLNP